MAYSHSCIKLHKFARVFLKRTTNLTNWKPLYLTMTGVSHVYKITRLQKCELFSFTYTRQIFLLLLLNKYEITDKLFGDISVTRNLFSVISACTSFTGLCKMSKINNYFFFSHGNSSMSGDKLFSAVFWRFQLMFACFW